VGEFDREIALAVAIGYLVWQKMWQKVFGGFPRPTTQLIINFQGNNGGH